MENYGQLENVSVTTRKSETCITKSGHYNLCAYGVKNITDLVMTTTRLCYCIENGTAQVYLNYFVKLSYTNGNGKTKTICDEGVLIFDGLPENFNPKTMTATIYDKNPIVECCTDAVDVSFNVTLCYRAC